jgi:hypothetical protein
MAAHSWKATHRDSNEESEPNNALERASRTAEVTRHPRLLSPGSVAQPDVSRHLTP